MKILSPILIFIILFALPSISFSNTENSIMTLPVVPKLSILKGEPLCKGSLNLKINGIPRSIYKVRRIERSLNDYNDIGRDIILSFMTPEAYEKLCRGISYFVSDVLKEHDSLIIVTPVRAYRLKPDNKEEIIRSIRKMLIRDCKNFNNMKMLFEKRIRSELKKIGSIISAGRSLYNNTRYSKVLFRFLNSFPEELDQYLKFTLMHNFEKFEGVTDQFLVSENEKWWIHFNNEDTGEVIDSVRRILKLIESAGPVRSGNNTSNRMPNPVLQSDLDARSAGEAADENYRVKFSRFIKEVRQSLNFKEKKVIKEIGSKIRRSGICFNTITFDSKEMSGNDINFVNSSVSERIFGNICTGSGGKTLFENNIEKALKEIASHKFILYHLDFPLFRKDNGLTIDLNDKFSLMKGYSYTKVLSDEYINRMRLKLLKEKCRIGDLLIKKNRINFKLEGFERNEDEVGLLKVGIRIFDKYGKDLYKNENILRSSPDKKRISLSIPIPGRIQGDCSLKVSVTDLIAGKTSSSRKEIKL